ncbi:hypothetical protein [Sphaerisporangium aureirubrum]|uniref:Hedgehog/Intein (Hint) domain-containing protein n=1 Tax=Sphaerisporangium aureirubrum TaxID=1544736 RepID=A0ABW1NCF8_9ACTN
MLSIVDEQTGLRHGPVDPGTQLWHGGYPGLKPGDLLLPPDQTGILTTAQILTDRGVDPHALGMEPDRMRRDRVYLTTGRELARAYAACWTIESDAGVREGPPGALYLARPIGESWPDPDMPPGVGIECERAEVVAVVKPAVRLTLAAIDRRMAPFMRVAP